MLNRLIPNKFVTAKEQLTLLLTINNKTVLSEYKNYYYIRTCMQRETCTSVTMVTYIPHTQNMMYMLLLWQPGINVVCT